MTAEYGDNRLPREADAENTISHNSIPKILLILFAFCEKNIIRYAVHAIALIPGIGIIAPYVMPTLYIALILLCIRGKMMIGLAEMVIPAFVVLSIVFTCIFYPQNEQFIFDKTNFWQTIFPCLPWFIVGLAIIPDKKIMELLGIASCFAVLLETAYLVFYMIPNDLMENDDMSRAYQLLPNILLVVNYAFDKKKVRFWAVACVGIAYLLSLGTRGPFLILMAYLAIRLLQAGALSLRRRGFLAAGIVCLGALLSIPATSIAILKGIGRTFKIFGISTRIIDFMLEGTMVSYVSGRDEIYAESWEMLTQRPFLGYGVYGEWNWVGWNVHNMYLEILLHFGVILGSALLIWGISLVCRAYFKNKNRYAKDLILIFACFVFLRGVFGGSYLSYGVFFLLGLCCKELRRIKKDALQQPT